MLRALALLLTALTGFSALVYQVAWQRALASLLGSQSEATAAVLGLFLGGLSLGYALCGRLSRRLVRRALARGTQPGLLAAYALVECGIGLFALLFPWSFAGIRALSLELPAAPGALGFAADVGLAALLIGPPAVLMGGTIPLLTQGLARDLRDATRLHSLVYGWNTAGAFAGALAAGFVLVPALGLETTIRAMGAINLLAGLCFAALRRRETPLPAAPAAQPAAATPAGLTIYTTVALLAGFAMMTLQTALNRIGALALGGSHFTFSMVVATFVLCIALGSFGVAGLRRIRPRWVALSQWMLVAYLAWLYAALENAPFWAHVLRTRFAHDTAGFYGFHLAVFGALLAFAILPLGLSGALLPLLFHQLRREAGDLGRVAGRLYAWNTLGSLLGALLGGYALLFWLDLHTIYRLSVLALAVGAALLTPRMGLGNRRAAALALLGVAALLVGQPAWRPQRLSAGLFRTNLAPADVGSDPDAYFASPAAGWIGDRLLFYTDDPATSVAVMERTRPDGSTSRSVLVNGKVDGNVPGDNVTTGLLALLPALLAERCERAFVIGWGTGMSVGELAALESTREVVVAEISPGVMQAAPFFEDYNRRALASPKTRVVRSDAYRALLREDTRYDVIVSEPSNPWVTGVELLYSVEFLRAARARLAPGGVYAQWFHLYETDAETVALVLRTYRAAFDRIAVWTGISSDLVILGFEDADHQIDLARLERRTQRADFRALLAALSLDSLPALLAHERLPLGVVERMQLPGPVHRALQPILSHSAALAFYRAGVGRLPAGLEREAAEAGAHNSLVRRWAARRGGRPSSAERARLLRETCDLSRAHCATLFARWLYEEPDSRARAAVWAEARREPRLERALAPAVVERLAALFEADATREREPSYALARDLRRVFEKYYHHAAPFDAQSLRAAWRRCAERDPRCASEFEHVLGLGIGPPLLSQR